MPPFQSGWILLQISKPASCNTLRRLPRIPTEPACRALSASCRRGKAQDDPAPLGHGIRIFERHGDESKLKRVDKLEFPSDELTYEAMDEGELNMDFFEDKDPLESLETSPEERKRIFAELGIEPGNIDASLRSMLQESELDSHHVEPEDTLPRQSRIYLDRFNEALDEILAPDASKTFKDRQEVWMWYMRCKRNVPSFTKMISRRTWDVLRQSQIGNGAPSNEFTQHLSILAADKEQVGWELTEPERIAKVEGLFLDGDRGSALEQWEKMHSEAGPPSRDLLRSGVHMFALQGDIPRAESVAKDLFEQHPDDDPRILVSLISACCVAKDPDVARAIRFYAMLRQGLGKRMKMQDYDDVCHAFLAIGAKDAALAVFRDMMLAGEVQAGKQTDTALAGPPVALKDLFALSSSAEETTRLGLDSLRWLPRRFQNKMFYASWLKKLIGEGDIASAAKVVDLMTERGVKPDARHVNGLITTWMREGGPSSRYEAEVRGWTMIQNRLNFVAARRAARGDQAQHAPLSAHHPALNLPIEPIRKLPMATIETFCILVQFYLRRTSFEHVRHLRNLLDAAEIPLNAFFMNHLLHAELRNRGPRATISRFNHMTRSVPPDMESHVICWEALKRHLDGARRAPSDTESEPMPSPRELFAQTLAWFQALAPPARAEALADLDAAGVNEIIRAFCLAVDLEGAFAVLATLYRTFGVRASADTAQHLVMLVSRLDLIVDAGRRASARHRAKENLNRAAAVLEQVRQHRRDLIVREGGVDPWPVASLSALHDVNAGHEAVDGSQLLTPDEVAVENTRTLCMFLYAVIANRRNGEERTRRAIEAALRDMGVQDPEWDHVLGLTIKPAGTSQEDLDSDEED